MLKSNIRDRAANKLQPLGTILYLNTEGKIPPEKMVSSALKDMDEMIDWLVDRKFITKVKTKTRELALKKIMSFKELLKMNKSGKLIPKGNAKDGLKEIDEIMNWLDKREYKTK